MELEEAIERAAVRQLETQKEQVVYKSNIAGHFMYISREVWNKSQGRLIGFAKEVIW